jgi:hypothetical protein
VHPNRINDSKYWREQAAKARARAEKMRDPTPRRMMLDIAESYEQLAQLAESRTETSDPAA